MIDASIEWEAHPDDVADKFEEFLDALESRLDERVAIVAESVASMAATLAPVDTGELMDSISATMEGVIETLVISGAVVAEAAHAPFVEFGTIHMSAQPYLAPALDAHREMLVEQSEAAIADARREVFGY